MGAVVVGAVVVGGVVLGGVVVGGVVLGGGVVGGFVLGGGVVGGFVLGGGVVGGFVAGGGVVAGFVVGVGDFAGVGDFDEAGVPVAPTTTTLLAGLPAPVLPTGLVVLLPATVLCAADGDWVWVGIVVLPPSCKFEPLLLEISTATIATTPMAAADIPAIRKFRLPELGGPGTRSGAPW